MMNTNKAKTKTASAPVNALRHHVTGAIERGEATAIVEQKAAQQPQPETRTIPLAKVNQLEKRMGKRIWDGVIYNRDGISNPSLTILANKVGNEILEVLKLEAAQQPQHSPLRQITVAQYGTFFALKNGSDTLATSPIREPLDALAHAYNHADKLDYNLSLLVRTVNDTLRHGLTDGQVEALEDCVKYSNEAMNQYQNTKGDKHV